MDMSRTVVPAAHTDFDLVSLPRRLPATVAAIDWARLALPEARRLRELGFDEGVPVEVLQENAATLENVLWDFNVKGEIINVRPGPVVTLNRSISSRSVSASVSHESAGAFSEPIRLRGMPALEPGV